MKKLLFVKNIDDLSIQEQISTALDQTRVTYSISIASKCVIVEGSNDLVRAAIVTIRELGYTVE